MMHPRFVQPRQRRYFRFAAALAFILAIGVLAACRTPSGQGNPRAPAVMAVSNPRTPR